MNSNKSFIPEIIVETSVPESRLRENKKHPPSHSGQEQCPRLVKRLKPSQSTSRESAKRTLSSSGSSTVAITGVMGHNHTQDSLIESEQLDVPYQSRSSQASFDHETKDTSLMTVEEEDHHPQTVAWNNGFTGGAEDTLDRDWDLAQIGSFVDDEEAITEALLAAPEEVLDVVAARLEKTLREAEAILSKLKSAFQDAEDGDV
ncbi:uncharacterized protein PV07_07989 [Cladophialophora immunda]|uniref:Uncharacterized protein n=1 Tax=Cladophialophora immunda TaxID=569365 RepID=A0A0D2CDD4_9EURO|nr:uncharacterized protein PV07_07989 [Cladophialophora immunda]KIW28315.1 hypothetical protein PV07_07989 [Cladophialophora immunda]